MRKVRNQKGFTIMELMIVIVIIGILLAIAIPAYNSFRDTAERRACESNMRTILSANGLYYAEHGANAASIDLLDAYLDNASTMECPDGDNANPTYAIAGGIVTCESHGTLP